MVVLTIGSFIGFAIFDHDSARHDAALGRSVCFADHPKPYALFDAHDALLPI